MSMFYFIVKFNLLTLLFIVESLSASQQTHEQRLYHDIKSGKAESIDAYNQQNFNFNYISPTENRTFLQCAIAARNIRAAQKLLPKVNPNQLDNFGGTALHTAVSTMDRELDLEFITLLLTHLHIDTRIVNINGYTAYKCAKMYNHDKAMKLLQEHEQAIELKNVEERKKIIATNKLPQLMQLNNQKATRNSYLFSYFYT